MQQLVGEINEIQFRVRVEVFPQRFPIKNLTSPSPPFWSPSMMWSTHGRVKILTSLIMIVERRNRCQMKARFKEKKSMKVQTFSTFSTESILCSFHSFFHEPENMSLHIIVVGSGARFYP